MILYGLDIETDTSQNGFDPSIARVLSVAVASHDGSVLVVLDDEDEVALLGETLNVLHGLEPGTVATWNGSGFDLSFLAIRLSRYGFHHNWDLWQSARPAKYPPVGGYPVRARIGTHAHIDVAFPYQALCETSGIEWSLKPVARHFGRTPIEVDRASTHTLSQETLRAYVASDAVETAYLAHLLGAAATQWID